MDSQRLQFTKYAKYTNTELKYGTCLWTSFGLVLATAKFALNLDRLKGLKVRDPSWLCLKSYLA